MAAFAVAVIAETRFGPDIRSYLERIDGTLTPFGGVFRVHGGPYRPLEGAWSGDLIVIEFPDMASAKGWYDSPSYQEIKRLRSDNTTGTVLLVEGVPSGHRATDILR
jgi:uncharacterized protein (DUF1330 family)